MRHYTLSTQLASFVTMGHEAMNAKYAIYVCFPGLSRPFHVASPVVA
jgi:hypothetical protein